MTQKPLDPVQKSTLLKSIHEGMDVIDSKNDKIGSVSDLYFGADVDETDAYGAGAATAPNPMTGENDLVEDVVEAIFGANELPEEMRKRLLNNGFLRIDTAGLFASDRYVLPEQIDHIADKKVYLNVHKDELLKR